MDHVLNINTILHTKDGRKIGNAIVTGRDGSFWEITTDYGNKVRVTSQEIDELFHIAWSDMTYEKDLMTCDQMQKQNAESHKNRVDSFTIKLLIQDLKRGDKFSFSSQMYVVKQKFSDWKKNGEPYMVTECGQIFYYGELMVEEV